MKTVIELILKGSQTAGKKDENHEKVVRLVEEQMQQNHKFTTRELAEIAGVSNYLV